MAPMKTRVYAVLNSLGCTYNLFNLWCKVGWETVPLTMTLLDPTPIAGGHKQ